MNSASRLLLLASALLLGACATAPEVMKVPPPEVAQNVPLVSVATVAAPLPPPTPVPIKIGLALGGGAARGFAHIGVIKSLESHGIVPDIVVGTSAGSLVGALYASGMGWPELQKRAHAINEDQVGDWGLPNRGLIKGEALQNYVNKAVGNQPLEKLARPFGVVATDLRSGAQLLFRTGNTGMAVRASSAVPGVFKPVSIAGRDYVDGGLTSPVPVQAARDMGADFVIAVDISAQPKDGQTDSLIDVLMQTFTIMGHSISRYETQSSDILIRPALSTLSATDFKNRSRAIWEGEKATSALMPSILAALESRRFPNQARGR